MKRAKTKNSVNIGELKDHLSAYLREVRNGNEVIVRDRNRPVARIVPYTLDDLSERDRILVESGILKLPEKPVRDWKKFWDEFWALPAPNVSRDVAVQALLDEREEGY